MKNIAKIFVSDKLYHSFQLRLSSNFLIKSFCALLDCKHMALEVKEISLKWVKGTDKNVVSIQDFSFHYLTFCISGLIYYFLKKNSRIKIFMKSNQFLFNILSHNVIKTYSVNDFTMGCPFNKVTQFSVGYCHLKYKLCKI